MCSECNEIAAAVSLGHFVRFTIGGAPGYDAPPLDANTGPCPCVCNSGGFCGGCGHAGCGGRR